MSASEDKPLEGLTKRIADQSDRALKRELDGLIDPLIESVPYDLKVVMTTDSKRKWVVVEDSAVTIHNVPIFLSLLHDALYQSLRDNRREQAYNQFVDRFKQFERELMSDGEED